MSEAYLDANGETDLYEQFLNLDIEDTDSFTLEDAYGHSAKFVKVPAEYEWCKGCKEHDAENHCCHRFSTFIRETVTEMRKEGGVTDCEVCEYLHDDGYCEVWERTTPDSLGGCTWGDKKGGACDSDYCDIGV